MEARPVLSSTIGFRYRPFEVGFQISDLDYIKPDFAGLGLTALARKPLGPSRTDFLYGASAQAVAKNGSVNPDFNAMYYGFVGLSYQTPFVFAGAAQPYFQVRVGLASTQGVLDSNVAPLIELHLGLSTAEQR